MKTAFTAVPAKFGMIVGENLRLRGPEPMRGFKLIRGRSKVCWKAESAWRFQGRAVGRVCLAPGMEKGRTRVSPA
jgi:hypothetical protein